MKRFFFFGMEVVPKIKHDTIVSNFTKRLSEFEADAKSQKEAYLHLADELEEYKRTASVRDKRGRFMKRSAFTYNLR